MKHLFLSLGLRIGGDTEEVVEEIIDDPFADDPDSKRAAEYENLARMCLQKGQYVLVNLLTSSNTIKHQTADGQSCLLAAGIIQSKELNAHTYSTHQHGTLYKNNTIITLKSVDYAQIFFNDKYLF